MQITPPSSAAPPLAQRPGGLREDADSRRAMQTAKEFETAFLAEMLKHTGTNAMPDGFGGGAGEEAFASFLTEEYARLISERGGVGLAEQIFNSMTGDTSK